MYSTGCPVAPPPVCFTVIRRVREDRERERERDYIPPSHIAVVPSTSITGTSLMRDSEILLCLFEFCKKIKKGERYCRSGLRGNQMKKKTYRIPRISLSHRLLRNTLPKISSKQHFRTPLNAPTASPQHHFLSLRFWIFVNHYIHVLCRGKLYFHGLIASTHTTQQHKDFS